VDIVEASKALQCFIRYKAIVHHIVTLPACLNHLVGAGSRVPLFLPQSQNILVTSIGVRVNVVAYHLESSRNVEFVEYARARYFIFSVTLYQWITPLYFYCKNRSP
jgi:hypothetical protein